jgi:hypothetical protein
MIENGPPAAKRPSCPSSFFGWQSEASAQLALLIAYRLLDAFVRRLRGIELGLRLGEVWFGGVRLERLRRSASLPRKLVCMFMRRAAAPVSQNRQIELCPRQLQSCFQPGGFPNEVHRFGTSRSGIIVLTGEFFVSAQGIAKFTPRLVPSFWTSH